MGRPHIHRRILHVITGLELGGAEALLVECADRGRARGFEPLVVSLKSGGPNRQRLEARGIQVVELDLSALTALPAKLAAFIHVVAEFRPALTQSWLYDANMFVTLASFVSNLIRRERTAWGLFGTVPVLSSCSHRLRAMVRVGALGAGLPAAIVYNAESAKLDHQRVGYRARRVVVFRNFIDDQVFRPDPGARASMRARLGLADEAVVAIAVGRNTAQKSWAMLLKAVEQVEGLVTLIVGPGTEDLPEQANVMRLGPSLEMPKLYAAADLFLLSSSFGEGTSVAVCEAMACGLPVVVTDVGDNGLVGRQAGFATAPGDLLSFVEAIRRLAQDGALRASLGAAARTVAVEQFSAARELETVMQLYAELCEARG